MFLVEGERGAILHTGDMRAEEHFIQFLLARTHLCRLSLRHTHMPISPAISSRVQPNFNGESDSDEHRQDFISTPRLCNLYIDTERLLDCAAPLTKSEAILDVIQLLRLFPRSTRVHISCWTSGYEEFLLSLAKAFPEDEVGKIHLDRYTMGMYQIMARHMDFDGLQNLGSIEKNQCGRFCASDEQQCVEESDLRIEANESMSALQWKEVKDGLLKKIDQARQKKCPWPNKITLPLQRHSPLREIYAMIQQLQPIKVTANTAHCSARFLLSQISQRLSLSGCKEEGERQRSLMGSKGRIDAGEWKLCVDAWLQSSSSLSQADAFQGSNEEFFQRVSRFHSALRGRSKPDLDRVAKERMDAEECIADQTVIERTSSAVPGPWSGEGRYVVDSSPFLTPAMRRAAAAAATATRTTGLGNSATSPSRFKNQACGPLLTVELASRYLAYASMFLGWKIKNPSRYRPELAWKAIRKMRPELAKQSEEALLRELGLPIPSWDEGRPNVTDPSIPSIGAVESMAATSTLQIVSLPKTPPLRASGIRKDTFSTPTNRKSVLQESISPLQLGAAALLHRLDEEVASQEMNGSGLEGQECHLELIKVNVTAESLPRQFLKRAQGDQEDVNSTSDDFATLEFQLRKAKKRRLWSDEGLTGEDYFQRIMSEWERPLQHLNLPSFRSQLNLIGVAVRSRRGREMLDWEKVDFYQAYTLLRKVYSTTSITTKLPLRGKAVLRYLREATRRGSATS